MTTTVSQVVERSLYHLLGNQREERNTLSAAITTTSQTTISFTNDLGNIRAGGEFEIGSEIFYVSSADATSKTATVIRGFKGSTATTYTSGSVVTVSPRFYRYTLIDEINNVLDELTSPTNGLFKMSTVDLSYQASRRGYNLTSVTDLIDVYDVLCSFPASQGDWRRVRNWELIRDMDTGDFASGKALLIDDDAMSGRTVRVKYKAPYTNITSLSDVVETVTGIHSQAIDLLERGAAINVMAGREIPRNNTSAQGDPRRAQETPPQAVGSSYQGLLRKQNERIVEEAMRLKKMYPMRTDRVRISG